MTNKNDAAFARPASEFTMNGTLSDGNDAINEQNGLTKREYFAGLAMQGILDNPRSNVVNEVYLYYEGIADESVKCADALIAELNKAEKE